MNSDSVAWTWLSTGELACQKLFNFASSKSIWFYVEHVIPYVEGYNLEGGPVNIVWGPVETFLNVEP